MKKQKQVHLKVFSVTSIKFERDSFYIGKARVQEGDHSIVNRTINFKGNFPSCGIGRSYEAYATLEVHPKFGDTYNLSGVTETMPTDRLGVIRYLTDTYALPFDYASAVVNTFGIELRGILDNATPELLTEKVDIDADTASQFLAEWQRSASDKDIEKMLIGVAGIGTKMVAKIKEWCSKQGMTIAQVVNNNPYQLMTIPRIGWKIADAIGETMGIAADDHRRIEAACNHVATKEESNGHTWTGKDALLAATSDMLGLPSHKVMDALMCQERSDNALLVIDEQQRCYTPDMLRCEQQLAYGLHRLMTGYSHIASNIAALDWQSIFDNASFKPTEEQQEAVEFLLSNKVSILIGGAGVGKSSCQRLVLDALYAAGVRRIKLCAPTGKAAKRLSETSGLQATTVHRLVNSLMNADPGSATRPDIVIVDESSMLDTQVAEWLVNALPDSCHLVFVGDDNQLPSVGAGRVLYDLIQAGVPMARLTKVLRQAGESKIISTSHAINRGNMPELDNDPDSDMFLFEVAQPDKVAEHVLRLITKAIPEKYGIAADDITVIAPQYKHACGIIALNTELQAVLNEQSFEKNEVRWFDKTLREGDKLIWTANNLDRGLVNGEECRVESIYQDHDDETGQYKTFIDLDVSERIPLDELTAVHGYAVTVHKAQGSEYPCAIVVAHSVHQFMLTRRLLYTAVTRGKELGIIIGERSAVQKAVGNIREDSRRTALTERLQALSEAHSEPVDSEVVSEV